MTDTLKSTEGGSEASRGLDTDPANDLDHSIGHRSITQRYRLPLSPTYLKSCFFGLISSVAAQSDDSTFACNISLGDARPGGAFAFSPWMRQGQCIRDVANFSMCRERLIDVLANVDEIHQTEYSASATVLTLLPTIGALFGSPTSEIWALLKMFPPAGALALFLSFGGSVFPTTAQDFVNVFKKQNVQSFTVEDDTVAKQQQIGTSGSSTSGRYADPLHEKVSTMLDATKNQRLPGFSAALLMGLGTLGLFCLWAANMAGMAIVEQGANYANWCTSTWWLHLWYLIVTLTTIFDAWIQLPFEERWSIYLTERDDLAQLDLPSGHNDLESLINTSDPTSFKDAFHDVQPMFSAPSRDSTRKSSASAGFNRASHQPRAMLAVISVTTEDKHIAFWRSGLRLFSRAVGLIIFVFATSVFAQVAILALPMAQMTLVLVMGGGLFGRAITSGIVSIVGERTPILHMMAESDDTANRLLKRMLQYRAPAMGQGQGNRSVLFEVSGKALVSNHCVGKRNPWIRRLFGLFAPQFQGVQFSDTLEMT